MTPSARALLVCALLLCALQESVCSRRAHCAGKQCVEHIQELEDFPGAQKRCKDNGEELYTWSGEDVQKLLTGSEGRYWVKLLSNHSKATSSLSCPSISLSTEGIVKLQWVPCRGTRIGYLCQYKLNEPCSGLQTGGGAQVKYTTIRDFEVHQSDTFPPGTIALLVKAGDAHPESKHLCAFEKWLRAPWNCEVLNGGCEHHCSSATHTCVCPPGKVLHNNNVSCVAASCEHHPCTGEGEECKDTREGFKCMCTDGFVEEDGACVNITICDSCEHLSCDKVDGRYRCACRTGFRVVAQDPTKCEFICTERDCPLRCDKNKQDDCFCPPGYIRDVRGSVAFCTLIDDCSRYHCQHTCENVLGGYKCSCREGFQLQPDRSTCKQGGGGGEGEDGSGSGSGSSPPPPPPPPPLVPGSAQPAAVPPYVKTGSVLGLGAFVALCAVLLFFLMRHAARRCGRFEFASIKHPDMDIFYLQQVSSESYKRFSQDKQFGGGS